MKAPAVIIGAGGLGPGVKRRLLRRGCSPWPGSVAVAPGRLEAVLLDGAPGEW